MVIYLQFIETKVVQCIKHFIIMTFAIPEDFMRVPEPQE